MRIAIFGDLHGYTKRALQFIDRMEPDACLQVGDYWEGAYATEWPVPMYWIWGNHERKAVLDGVLNGTFTLPKNNIMMRGGIVYEIYGLKVLGLPGQHRLGDDPGPAGYPPASMQRCLELEGTEIDIFLSHGCGFEFYTTSFGRQIEASEAGITNLLRRLKPKYAFSGHNHHYQYETFEGIECIRLGKCDEFGYGEFVLTEGDF